MTPIERVAAYLEARVAYGDDDPVIAGRGFSPLYAGDLVALVGWAQRHRDERKAAEMYE